MKPGDRVQVHMIFAVNAGKPPSKAWVLGYRFVRIQAHTGNIIVERDNTLTGWNPADVALCPFHGVLK